MLARVITVDEIPLLPNGKIEFTRPSGARRVVCSEVIETEPSIYASLLADLWDEIFMLPFSGTSCDPFHSHDSTLRELSTLLVPWHFSVLALAIS